MMTLDEAIAHARETADKLRKMTSITDGKPYEECLECAAEHEQLASWLEELKRYKSQKVMIKVKPQDANTLKKILRAAQFGIAYPDTQYEVVPMINGDYSKDERLKGKWIFETINGRDIMTCSNCCKVQTPNGCFAFCPNCGADMRGGAE